MWDFFVILFCYFKIHFYQLGSFKSIKTILKSLNVCKVYLQCGIVIQRVVTEYWLPTVQLSWMLNLEIEIAKNKCLSTIWSAEMNSIAWTYPARQHYKNAYFLWHYKLTPTWFMTYFLQHNFDSWLQKTCYAAVLDIPLHWYKLYKLAYHLWSSGELISSKWCVSFFLSGIV